METANLAGSVKVAILLKNLREDTRDAIMGRLDQEERKLLAGHLSQMGDISPDLVEKVAEDFVRALQGGGSTPKKIEHQQPGEGEGKKKPKSYKRDIPKPSNLKSLFALDPDHLVQLIREEHPQTIAVILVHLKPEMASEVLSRLPDEKKTEIALRIANSEKIVSGMIDEIERVFEEVLSKEQGTVTHKVGGVGQLAEILNQADAATSQLVMDEIEDDDPEMAAEIKQLMFVFEDLVFVDDKGLQAMLRKVETKELAVALKASSEEVKDKIFKNMSTRASDMVQEEIESAGSVRMKDVENSQQTITKLIQDMEEKGELIISGRGGEEFIA
ncbi:MAG: flagellar motor switch protein FliG [Desulfobacterales bacterium]|nr:flagellar motor switch protein FliG [Desulfobacterales bacterium]